MATHIDRSVHSDNTYVCVHTYHIYIRRAGSRTAVCGMYGSILSTVTAIRAHMTTVEHMYSCDQPVPKGHVMLAVNLTIRVTHVRSFRVQSKVKRFNNANVNDKYN